MLRSAAALAFCGAARVLAQTVPAPAIDAQPVLVAPRAHAGALQVIAVHPTEPWFVTAADDGEIHVRRLPDAALVRALKTASITSAAAHLASSRIATGGADGVIRVWDLRTGKMRASAKLNSRAAPALAWSPDGSRIAVRFWDKLTLLRADTLTIERELPPLTGVAHAAVFPNNTTLIASGYGDVSIPQEYEKV